ncbi:DUF6262 family protein [Streptomyces sp. TS71-3]|uniref:DUF6262 family protein n=1 Tax=Streptomyces sp. TS71-3 TaxID=2733862 RepID=UPI001B274030|nr:DUF6262 family protein [Streptomyces sp. TS71-3]GHJ37689.1 hypothetical protein Sm713_32980 [Streptomyces sp. TS71-3]
MNVPGDPRATALKAARQKDSEAKRARVLDVLARMQRDGVKITFASVAKAAGVSTWLVYAVGVREYIEAARQDQLEHGIETPPAAVPPQSQVSLDSLKTDLALARQQIKELRAERDKLRERLRLQLGAELDQQDSSNLVAVTDELSRERDDLSHQLSQAKADNQVLRERVTELEDDLTASRQSLRKMMRTNSA